MERAIAADANTPDNNVMRAESFSKANQHFMLAVQSAKKLAESKATPRPSKVVANRLFNQATCLLMERDPATIASTGLKTAEAAIAASKRSEAGLMRELECRCLEAAMHAVCGDTHKEEDGWRQTAALIPPQQQVGGVMVWSDEACVMRQRFLTEQAKSFAACNKNVEAAALRLQALQTTPKADLQMLWQAAKALEEDMLVPYEMRSDGTRARETLETAWAEQHGGGAMAGNSKGHRSGKHRSVIFLIDRTYKPILQPAIDAVKEIFQSTVNFAWSFYRARPCVCSRRIA